MISKQRGTFKMLFWVVFKSINKRSNRKALFSCQVLQTINTKLERFMCWLMGTCAKTYTSLYMPSYYICCLIASLNVVECTFSINFQVHGRIEGYNWGKCVNFISEKKVYWHSPLVFVSFTCKNTPCNWIPHTGKIQTLKNSSNKDILLRGSFGAEIRSRITLWTRTQSLERNDVVITESKINYGGEIFSINDAVAFTIFWDMF